MSGDFAIRALDLSMGWAGPLVTELLAEMGAEVIKVEDTRHFDWWRGSLAMAPPEMQPIERASVFNTVNRGKLGLTLDLSDPRGVALLKRMVANADVLVENFSPDVMRRLWLDYAELAAINPRLVMLSMPAFGSEGPNADSRAYGMTVEAMAGITSLSGYPEGGQPYMLSNALGDPVGGLNGALAVMAALFDRERTGHGQLVELAQVEGLIPFVAGSLVKSQLTSRQPQPLGNRNRQCAPHGIYRCAEKSWIALGIDRDERWPAFLRVLGLEHLGCDPCFADMASRKRNEDALDAEISGVTTRFDAADLAAKLQGAGIAAGLVASAPDVLGDAQLASREFFVAIDRAVVGTYLYPGAGMRMAKTPLRPNRPAPLLGEHNRRVLGEIIGLSSDELDELERAGLIGTRPRQP